MPSPELATDDQRWKIFELFGHFGIREMEQIRAAARSILKLEYLADLRSLSRADADGLIAELNRALADERVSDD